jgi:hypothetical protein
VGIFWYIKHSLLLDSTSLKNADTSCGYKNYPQGHFERWKVLQQQGVVSIDQEYEMHPRGRTVLDIKANRFRLFADSCILKRRPVIKRIIATLGLPADTELRADLHYRCYRCLGFEL